MSRKRLGSTWCAKGAGQAASMIRGAEPAAASRQASGPEAPALTSREEREGGYGQTSAARPPMQKFETGTTFVTLGTT
jgi:hypothetical protein